MRTYNLKMIGLLLAVNILWAAPSDAEINSDFLKAGRFYYGVEYGTLKLGIDEIADTSPKGEVEFATAKLILGNFFLSGHLDSYISLPLGQDVVLTPEIKGEFSPGVEAGYRLYLLPLGTHKVSPFIGGALSFPRYEFASRFGKGNRKFGAAVPITAGLGFLLNKGQVDIGIRKAIGQDGLYYFNPDFESKLNAEYDEFFINYKRFTKGQLTKGAGYTKTAKKFRPFISVAPSTIWFTQGSSEHHRNSALSTSNHGELMMDYALGTSIRLGHNLARLITQVSSRPVKIDYYGFRDKTHYEMENYGVEVLYSPFEIFGFAPFIGLGAGRHELRYIDKDNQIYTGEQNSQIITLGWDVMPNSDNNFHIRFLSRYQPELLLETDAIGVIKFPNAEVNYIGFVWQY